MGRCERAIPEPLASHQGGQQVTERGDVGVGEVPRKQLQALRVIWRHVATLPPPNVVRPDAGSFGGHDGATTVSPARRAARSRRSPAMS